MTKRKRNTKRTAKNVTKTQRKTPVRNVGRKGQKSARKIGRTRKAKTPVRNVERKKSVSKARYSSTLRSKGTKQGRKGVKVSAKVAPPTRVRGTVTTSRQRGKEIVSIGFKGVKAIDKKVLLVNTSKVIDKAIDKQLKREKGKPPKGLLLIVEDKKGKSAAILSKPSFVANKKNIKKLLDKFTKSLKKDFAKSKRYMRPMLDTGYGDINPDNIHKITLKFLYGKPNR